MIRIWVILAFITTVSCNNDSRDSVVKSENNGDPVFGIDNDDREMNIAIAKAAASYDDFLKALGKADSIDSDFSVKVRFDYGEEGYGEHMWLNNLHFKNENLYGLLDSEPMEVKGIHPGDTIEINRHRVSDWMYLKENKLIGGYTLKVLYNKMSKKKQKEFREQLGFDIE